MKSEETSAPPPIPEPPVPMPSPTPTTLDSLITPTPPTPTCPNPFDKRAVIVALKTISLEGCKAPGGGGGGSVTITFAPKTGAAIAVTVSGTFLPAEIACITKAFKAAHVPPFCPPQKTVGWKITL